MRARELINFNGTPGKYNSITDVDDVEVDIVFEPPWNPEMISDEGKKELGID